MTEASPTFGITPSVLFGALKDGIQPNLLYQAAEVDPGRVRNWISRGLLSVGQGTPRQYRYADLVALYLMGQLVNNAFMEPFWAGRTVAQALPLLMEHAEKAIGLVTAGTPLHALADDDPLLKVLDVYGGAVHVRQSPLTGLHAACPVSIPVGTCLSVPLFNLSRALTGLSVSVDPA